MRFLDNLTGERFSLLSDLPPGKVAERLDADIESIWTPFATGVLGWVAFGRFALRIRHSAWIGQDWAPVLTGRIRSHGGGCRITIRNGPPLHLLILPAIAGYLIFAALLNGVATGTAMTLGPLIFIGLAVGFMFLLSLFSAGYAGGQNFSVLLAVVEAAANRVD